MITVDQAVPILGAILGSGGVGGITVAVFGWLAARREGRPPSDVPMISIGGPEGPSAEASSIALASLSAHMGRLVAILEIDAEQRFKGRDFRSQVDGRAMLILQKDVRGHE